MLTDSELEACPVVTSLMSRHNFGTKMLCRSIGLYSRILFYVIRLLILAIPGSHRLRMDTDVTVCRFAHIAYKLLLSKPGEYPNSINTMTRMDASCCVHTLFSNTWAEISPELLCMRLKVNGVDK